MSLIKSSKRKMVDSSEKNSLPAKKGHWSMGLLDSMRDPKMALYSDDLIVIIKDKYPKARHHYLVLPKENIPDLKRLRSEHTKLVQHMQEEAKRYVDNQHAGIEFRFGYHAIPSMAQIHLHVISQDFDSPSLKTKKHWNSYNTKYFIDSEELLKNLKSDGKYTPLPSSAGKKYLEEPLQCHKCPEKPSNMPKLKLHLLKHIPKL